MSKSSKILAYLIDAAPQPISGQFIADQLNCSRNSVWKEIELLRAKGYQIDQIHRKGYVLKESVNYLEMTQLLQHLNLIWQDLYIEIHDSVTSTNDLAKQFATDNPDRSALFIAKKQTKGRGRYGRSFSSELEHGIYLSLVLKPTTKNFEDITLYTIMSASAMAQSLSTYTDEPIQIKWVNDLFYQGKKIAGILCESIMDVESHQVNSIIIGIGVNLAGDFNQADVEIQQVAGTLFGDSIPLHFNENQFINLFISKFIEYHDQLEERAFFNYYQTHLLGMGRTVSYSKNNQLCQGIIRGVNSEGHLLVETNAHQLEALSSNEIHFASKQFTKF